MTHISSYLTARWGGGQKKRRCKQVYRAPCTEPKAHRPKTEVQPSVKRVRAAFGAALSGGQMFSTRGTLIRLGLIRWCRCKSAAGGASHAFHKTVWTFKGSCSNARGTALLLMKTAKKSASHGKKNYLYRPREREKKNGARTDPEVSKVATEIVDAMT